ncbi:hypothetical protein INT47_008230 [Mucor saturninus]|uniref:Uncharacterized protein n=1 Tax=Mucor saturninus TaxID=64648 RepID=A0A8H7R575_9FUNG|nr:hypothetical protein INT47_008230 [Mucor saturninus]
MKDQNDYRYLKAMPGIFELVIDILETNQANLFRKLSFLPVDGNPFLEFIQFAMFDFILNCKIWTLQGHGAYTMLGGDDIRRCEKKATDSDYVWLVTNNFTRERKDSMKLLDGVGQMTISHIMNYLLMESSGQVEI